MTAYDLTGLVGLAFVHPTSGEEFGLIRPVYPGPPPEFLPAGYDRVAEDEGGNCFLAASDGAILFWDHETGDLTHLASSWDQFRTACSQARPVALDPNDVISVWIRPDFAKQQGIDVPPDGWVKREGS